MQFELAFARPPASLGGIAREYVGWIDRSQAPVCLREVPSGNIPLIIYFQGHVDGREAFIAGLHESATIVRSCGPASGVQANLTALGARLLFNRPLVDFTNHVVSLDEVFGASVRRLQAELHDAGTWEARFAVLDREIMSRLVTAERPPDEIAWAWGQLTRTRGQATIGVLAKKVGWSERHFARQFNHHIGMTPKVFARVLRFGRAVRCLKREGEARLADVALDCGYYDQAHFTRDFREFAGVSPTELLARRRPAESGFSGDT